MYPCPQTDTAVKISHRKVNSFHSVDHCLIFEIDGDVA